MRTIVLAIVMLSFFSRPAWAQHRFLANQGNKLAIFDAKGDVVWQHTLKAAPHDMQLLANGNLLTHQGTEVIELDLESKQVIWSLDAKKFASAGRVEVHSVQAIADDLVMIALSGEGKLLEVDRQGNLHHSIALQREHPSPHRDTRLVRRLANGEYLVAQEGDGKVCQYDRQGQIVWQYEVPMFGKPPAGGHGPEAFGNSVFSALRLANGNTLIGTGNGHSVLEVTPEKEIVWKITQNDLPKITLAWITTLERLGNGHTIIGNCHAGKGNPQLIEVTADKQVVWSFENFEILGNSVSNSLTLDTGDEVLR